MSGISVSTIKSPEFINLQPLEINPLMSACQIKVLYVGGNRNGSFITKEVATEMSKTLRGAPIVGYYSEDKEDFRDHGDQLIIDGDGIKFNSLTKPYGFVAPDAKVWFQEFEDTDEFGNTTTREYLMTTGYLWTGQYEEVDDVIKSGRPHSMELDNDTLDGKWANDSKSGMDFFIINDAIFSKLCILGKDVEPCFENSNIIGSEINKSFTKIDNEFKQSLYTMMQQLNFALKGGQQMENKNMEGVNTDFSAEEGKTPEPVVPEVSFTQKQDDNTPNASDEENNDKYSLLEQKFTELEQKYSDLQTEYSKLEKFKNNVEDKEKEQLINSFYMLSDEDKKDVIENKSKYSLEEIEAKLSVICVRKKVNFDLDNKDKIEHKVEDNPATTFNLQGAGGNSVPEWISAVRNTKNSRNN